MKTSGPFPKVMPLAPGRYGLQLTIDQGTRDKLQYARELLGHQVSSGDLAQVLDRALDALISQLEKQKFAATSRPRQRRRPTSSRRHMPAHVKRAVRERDGGQCTFVSKAGRRCPARTRLEFDHVQEVARGGRATVEGIRLRCRAHNQYAAERTFGIEFMRHKRTAARSAAARRQAEARGATEAQAEARSAAAQMAADEVIPALRALGFNTKESHRAAEYCAATSCEAIPRASLEDRVKLALSYLCPRFGRLGRASTGLGAAP
jgi:5-methylcytosine-specific restriction endonuclease McrA